MNIKITLQYMAQQILKEVSKNYINIPLSKEFLKSQSKEYVNKFIENQN